MTSSDALLEPRRVDSRADYGWVKMGTPDDGYTYPETPYEQVMEHCMSQYVYIRPVFIIVHIAVCTDGLGTQT
jgi:hypothetical protein